MLWQVIRTADTSDSTVNELTNFVRAMQKVPVTCKVRQMQLRGEYNISFLSGDEFLARHKIKILCTVSVGLRLF